MPQVEIEIIGPHPLAGTAAFTRFPVKLGRGADCDLAFDAELDRATSVEHATIHFGDEGFVLTDLGSTNGTYVNGSRITTAVLKDGDRIELGHGGPHLRVHLAGPEFDGDLTAKTIIPTAELPALELKVYGTGGAKPYRRSFRQRVVTLGRENDNDVAFGSPPDPVVSRYHAEIIYQAGEFRLIDKGATNGTLLNGEPVQAAALHHGDRIALGQGGPELRVALPDDREHPHLSRLRLAGIFVLLLAISILSVFLAPPRQAEHVPGPPGDFTDAQFVEQSVRNFARALNSDIRVLPPSVIADIQAHIDTLVKAQRPYFLDRLRRAQKLMPAVQGILRENGLPPLLAYIAFQESRFDPHARSRAGAVGLWQFMPATAREYGLRVDRSQDDRLDPARSTAAAARYLKKLYLLYGDFVLAMAAYNYGRENINEALIRIIEDDPLHNRNYWYLAQNELIPRETAEYVHKIIAGWIVAANLERYGFPSELAPDTVEGRS
jgi:pSer/pThr/pTyr-binding forkhead associated (FHA) protein/soluble lytic murein transglycosylase-like protein